MMENNEKRLSFKEACKRNLRAWKIWQKLCPKFFISVVLSSVFSKITPYVTIFLSARIINELAGSRNPDELVKWVSAALICEAALALINSVLSRWKQYQTLSVGRLDDRTYIEKMLSLDYADIDRQYVFDLYSQIQQSENWAGWGILGTTDFFEYIVSSATQILGGIGLSVSLFLLPVPEGSSLAFLNSPLSAVMIIALMLAIAVISPMCTDRGNRFWTLYAEESRMGNRFFSFFGFMCHDRERAADLRMYCQQENVCNQYTKRNNAFGPHSNIAKYARGPMGFWMALSQCVSVVLTGAIYLFVCLKAWGGAFGVGSVTQYVGAITQMFLGISALLEVLGDIRTNGEFLKDSFEFLDIPNNMYKGSLTTEKRADRQYSVEFKDVSFKYPGSDQWALRHVSIKFKVGSRLAVVGMNGSGKTTFIKLLCRLYDPTEGQILLNGIDIRKYKYDDYISIFSVVFQDFKLFALPLGENVAGSARYDREKVSECLKNAGFEERMNTMPKGLDTYLYKNLDEEGVEISGGEAQKIAIARALYKDAPFIVLDEPTAALDPVAEAEIYSKFDSIAGDKTAIYISHRLSSCKFCDEIAVFDEGKIVQHGSHKDLLSDEKGKYSELWFAQAQYYA